MYYYLAVDSSHIDCTHCLVLILICSTLQQGNMYRILTIKRTILPIQQQAMITPAPVTQTTHSPNLALTLAVALWTMMTNSHQYRKYQDEIHARMHMASSNQRIVKLSQTW